MPMQRALYPPNWDEISLARRQAVGWKCEWCGIAQGAPTRRGGKVVLTVAHYPDPDPMNCADENLQALCQRCHNRLDGPMRAVHGAQTRARKKREAAQVSGQLELFG